MSPSFKFHKTERLKNHHSLTALFKSGQSFSAYPLRVVYVPIEQAGNFPAEFALSAPKKKFPNAVDRNRLRRQIREAYRLHKHMLYEDLINKDQRIALMVMYVAKEKKSYKEIEKAMKRIIKGLQKAIVSKEI